MATTATTGFSVAVPAPVAETIRTGLRRRRSISPQAGRALEILGHAIEYLTDEFIHQGGTFCSSDSRLQAVQLLMAINRQIYLDCPEVPAFTSCMRSLLHLQAN
jgi:hypothetical protein